MSREKCRLTVLDDGLRVVTHRVQDAPSADITIGIMAGARDEVDGDYPRGTAHCLEHNFAYGSEKYPTRVRPLIEGDDGNGEFNLATQLSFTNCHARVPLKRAEFSLDVLGAMISKPNMRAADVDKERGPIQAERIKNKLNFTSLENILASYIAHGRHPRLHPIIGSKVGIDAASADALRGFHAQHIRAGRTVIGVEGDIAHADVVRMVRKSFSLPPGSRAPSEVPLYTGGDSRYALNLEGTHIAVAFKGPVESDFERGAAFQVACKLLNMTNAAGRHSIFDALRDEGGAVYSVGVVGRQTLDSGVLTIAADISPDNVHAALRLIRAVLRDLAADVDEKSFGRIRAFEENNFQRLRNSKKFGAYNLVDDVFMHDFRKPPEYYSALRLRVEPDDVRRAVQDMLLHPPTFLAAGETEGLPSPGDVRDIFSGENGWGQASFDRPIRQGAALGI